MATADKKKATILETAEYKIYICKQTRVLKDGTIKVYENKVKVKKRPKGFLGKRGKDKKPRKSGSGKFSKGRPKRYTKDIYELALKLSTEKQILVINYLNRLKSDSDDD